MPTTFAPGLVIQGFTPPLSLTDFKLIAFDMDSTLIDIECVDEIADAVGLKEEVAAITEAAMRGEIADYKDSLRRRVALLRGVTVADMELVYTSRLELNPGAERLVQACKAAGMKTLLVSGGFTFFTERVMAAAGFHANRANTFVIENDALVGQVGEPILGKQAKLDALTEEAAALGVPLTDSIAIGDGANDLAMIKAAGLGVAYRAKPIVAAEADCKVDFADLTAVLHFQGYRQDEFA